MILVPWTVGSATPSHIALACSDAGHDTWFVVDPSDDEAVAHLRLLDAFGTVVQARTSADVRDALGARRPAAVVTFADATLPITAAVADAFDLPGHAPDSVEWLVDKGAQRRRLNEAGVGSVATVDVRGGTAAADLPPLPLPGVLKPSEGAGSRDTLFVDTIEEVANELARHGEDARFVVERRIGGGGSPFGPRLADYLSVESFLTGDDVVHLGMTGRLPLAEPARERGLVFPLVLDPGRTDAVLGLAAAAIDALAIDHGIVHTEIKAGADGFEVIEVNARLGGGLSSIVPAAGGPDPVGVAVDLALGIRPAHPASPPRVALHLYVQPPFAATGLVTAPHPRVLRALDGVYAVDRRATIGDALDWRTGSAGRIFDVWIEADDIDEALARVDAVEATVASTTEWTLA